jgi:hypothetical protein
VPRRGGNGKTDDVIDAEVVEEKKIAMTPRGPERSEGAERRLAAKSARSAWGWGPTRTK